MKNIFLLFVISACALAQTEIQTPVVTGNAAFIGTVNYCADAGSTDAYACSISPAITAYVTGGHYAFRANTVNTGAATINFNSLGAKTIVKVAGGITTPLADGDIKALQIVDVRYDGTNMQMQSTLGNAAASGSSLPSDTGLGKQVLTSDGSGGAAWKQAYEYFSVKLGSCNIATVQSVQVSISGSVGTIGCFGPSGFTENIYIPMGTTEDVSIYTTINLPDTFVSGSTLTVWAPFQSDQTTGNTTLSVSTSCDLGTYNTATSVVNPNPGTPNQRQNFVFTGVATTGCVAKGFMAVRLRSNANTGNTAFVQGFGGKIAINTY